MSPRFAPATVTELGRCPLLADLPGERLAELARRMRREELPVGATPAGEGTGDERFYVVLSGLLAASPEGLGPRRVLRPGDTFGEAGAAPGGPRTGSVHALTPAVVASCDRATLAAAFGDLGSGPARTPPPQGKGALGPPGPGQRERER
jgi:CRP-like cAMP-binding protein